MLQAAGLILMYSPAPPYAYLDAYFSFLQHLPGLCYRLLVEGGAFALLLSAQPYFSFCHWPFKTYWYWSKWTHIREKYSLKISSVKFETNLILSCQEADSFSESWSNRRHCVSRNQQFKQRRIHLGNNLVVFKFYAGHFWCMKLKMLAMSHV